MNAIQLLDKFKNELAIILNGDKELVMVDSDCDSRNVIKVTFPNQDSFIYENELYTFEQVEETHDELVAYTDRNNYNEYKCAVIKTIGNTKILYISPCYVYMRKC